MEKDGKGCKKACKRKEYVKRELKFRGCEKERICRKGCKKGMQKDVKRKEYVKGCKKEEYVKGCKKDVKRM